MQVFNNKLIQIKYFSRIDVEEVEYTGYIWSIGKEYLCINEDLYKLTDIIDIECCADDKTRVEMIYNCDDLQDAYAIAKYRFTEDILSALDFIQLMYGKTLDIQKEQLQKQVELKIADRHSNLTVESVLSHLYINTIGNSKMLTKVKSEVLNEMIKNIDVVIKKLEREIF